ncbi:peptide-methionine (R)-S-oxide reductase [uncultured Litoreibacter sp.]|uniref:peptide-methionine (R)-S-oxide reductase n=1 Tax=uncultured Litoreibacter sp. TaxID=1392394 RepID=UPI00262757F3|nr:peptide-methionine (R)-S-oxide reductase [uncultured Litoreibacter sp.]
MTHANGNSLTRRGFFASTGAAALTVASTPVVASVEAGSASNFKFEINRTVDEWLTQLGEQSYAIMREGFTEAPKSSPLWEETRAGTYHCKGCDLHNYSANQKVVLEKGWVFFYHAEPDSVLMAIDGAVPEYGAMSEDAALIELHCRRCAGHLGHLVIIAGGMKHCINGASLDFKPTAA